MAVYSSFIHHDQTLGAPGMSFSRGWVNKLWSIQTGGDYSALKKVSDHVVQRHGGT